MNKIINIKDIDQWNKIVQEHEINKNLIVVCFSGSWCGPCKALAPKLESLASTYNNSVLFMKIDIDECEIIAEKFNITSLPSTLLIKNCNVIKTIVGADYLNIKNSIDNQFS